MKLTGKEMQIIILEDDPDYARNLEEMICRNFKTIEIIANTDSLEEVEQYIKNMKYPVLFFLDIVIGKKSAGLNAARLIMESRVKSLIVFITDYPNKVMFHSTYKVHAYNVILKKSSRFQEEVRITIESALKDVFVDRCFEYQDRFTRFSIDINGIIYIETVKGKKKVCIYHENGIFMLNMRMNVMIQKLGEGFCRCHDSYIVNLSKITGVDKRERKITMSNGGICCYSYLKANKFLGCMQEREYEDRK